MYKHIKSSKLVQAKKNSHHINIIEYFLIDNISKRYQFTSVQNGSHKPVSVNSLSVFFPSLQYWLRVYVAEPG